MADPIREMIEAVTVELAGHGVSMETLVGQATGKAALEAPDGLAKLAQVFEPEYALLFFEFLKGYYANPQGAAPAVPGGAELEPALRAALKDLPIEEADKEQIVAAFMAPPAEAPTPETGQEPEDPQNLLDELNRQVQKLQAELDAKLAELKPQDIPAAPTEAPSSPPPENEQGVEQLRKAAQELADSLEKALNELPKG